MRRRWPWIAYWVILGIPSLSLGFVTSIPPLIGCEIGYGASDCPLPLGLLMIVFLPPAAFGFYTFIPFLAIGCVWLIMTLIMLIVQRWTS